MRTPSPMAEGWRSPLAAHREWLGNTLADAPDITLKEMCAALSDLEPITRFLLIGIGSKACITGFSFPN